VDFLQLFFGVVVFGKLFGKKTKQKTVRIVSSLDDVQVGDMLEFKDRPDLPEQIRGETLKISTIAYYQYESEGSIELTLEIPSGEDIALAYSTVDQGEVALSVKLPENKVLQVFDEHEFSSLWGDEFASIVTKPQHAGNLAAWVCDSYRQTVKEAVAYYFNEDRRGQDLSMHEDDGSEELRYHEAAGGTDEYSVNVEVWSSGETDVFLCRTFALSIITEYWPSE